MAKATSWLKSNKETPKVQFPGIPGIPGIPGYSRYSRVFPYIPGIPGIPGIPLYSVYSVYSVYSRAIHGYSVYSVYSRVFPCIPVHRAPREALNPEARSWPSRGDRRPALLTGGGCGGGVPPWTCPRGMSRGYTTPTPPHPST